MHFVFASNAKQSRAARHVSRFVILSGLLRYTRKDEEKKSRFGHCDTIHRLCGYTNATIARGLFTKRISSLPLPRVLDSVLQELINFARNAANRLRES